VASASRKKKLFVVETLVAIGIQVRKSPDCSMMFVARGNVSSKLKVKLLLSGLLGCRKDRTMTWRVGGRTSGKEVLLQTAHGSKAKDILTGWKVCDRYSVGRMNHRSDYVSARMEIHGVTTAIAYEKVVPVIRRWRELCGLHAHPAR
jgi:hypothetical protein